MLARVRDEVVMCGGDDSVTMTVYGVCGSLRVNIKVFCVPP